MEITIKMTSTMTRHKYIEDEKNAYEFYKEMCAVYGEENVKISSSYSVFYA